MTLTYDGTNWAIYKGSTADGSGASAQTLDVGSSIIGNGYSPGTEFFTGTIHHVLAYSRVLTPTEVAANYAYLKALWGTRGVTIP